MNERPSPYLTHDENTPADQFSPPPPQPILTSHKVIQPLSSAQELERQADASSHATAGAQNENETTNPSGAETANDYEGGLITEPLHHAPQSSPYPLAAVSPTPQQVPTERKKRSFAKLIIVIVIVLSALGAGVGAYVYSKLRPLTESDLVLETVGGSAYLRPKQWSLQPQSGDSAYGDGLGKDNKSTAMVALTLSERPISSIVLDDEVNMSLLRGMVVEQLDEDQLNSLATNINCIPPMTHEKTVDDSKTTTGGVGLYIFTIGCKRSDGEFEIKARGTVEADGHIRTLVVGATKSNWAANEAVYMKMLHSAQAKQ